MGPNSIGGHCGWLCATGWGWEQELIKPLWFWVKGRSQTLFCVDGSGSSMAGGKAGQDGAVGWAQLQLVLC